MAQHSVLSKSRSPNDPVKGCDDITLEEWMTNLDKIHVHRSDMNKLIMNYLVTEGFKEAAEKFQSECGNESLTIPEQHLRGLEERVKIRDAIQEGRILDAILLMNQLHPELLDNDPHLFFHLQQQHLIELIRAGETEAALKYAQQQLAERGQENTAVLTEMERTLALLAFDDPARCPFGDLLHMSHRQKVASEVNAAILQLESHGCASPPRLTTLLALLMWAQKQLENKKCAIPRWGMWLQRKSR